MPKFRTYPVRSRRTKHCDEPLRAEIVFSIGFHDFLSFISIVLGGLLTG